MAIAHLKWSSWTYGKTEATLRYDITGANTDAEAYSAQGLPAFNSSFPSDARLRAEWPRIEKIGPFGNGLYEGEVRYTVPQFGESHADPAAGNPLDEPVRYEWGRGFKQMPADMSADGYPIINAAGSPFDPPSTRNTRVTTLTVVKNVKFFDFLRAGPYQDSINSDTMTLWQPDGQKIDVLPGMMRCLEITPAPYTATSTYITAVAKFEIMQFFPWLPVDKRTVDYSPFHIWKRNEGFSGWYRGTPPNAPAGSPQTELPGAIYHGDEQVAEPVALKADGTPMDSRYTVNGEPPVANPNPPQGVQTIESPGGKSLVLVYRAHYARPFLALGIWS